MTGHLKCTLMAISCHLWLVYQWWHRQLSSFYMSSIETIISLIYKTHSTLRLSQQQWEIWGSYISFCQQLFWNFFFFFQQLNLYVRSQYTTFFSFRMPPDASMLCRYGLPFRAGTSPVSRYFAGVGTVAGATDIVAFQEVILFLPKWDQENNQNLLQFNEFFIRKVDGHQLCSSLVDNKYIYWTVHEMILAQYLIVWRACLPCAHHSPLVVQMNPVTWW